MSINSLFINALKAYKDDSGESLSRFKVDFKRYVNKPLNIDIYGYSLFNTPLYPNFKPTNNKLYIKTEKSSIQYDIVISLPPREVYTGPASGLNSIIDNLNDDTNIVSTPALPTNFNVDIGTFTYDTVNQNFIFSPQSGVEYYFYRGVNNANLKLGLLNSQTQEDSTPDPGSIGSTSVLNFLGAPFIARTQTIYISSNLSANSMVNIGNQNIEPSFSTGIIASINVDNPAYGSILTEKANYKYTSLSSPRSFDSITFTILDDDFEVMEFKSNTNLNLQLAITYANKTEKNKSKIRFPNA